MSNFFIEISNISSFLCSILLQILTNNAHFGSHADSPTVLIPEIPATQYSSSVYYSDKYH